ncbi:Multicopper oxidase with three cupredoxin domains (includes cell division protein FtsP and spore coat protein CotA) [Bosea sp. CRIB-10]|uniref:multicopper oxidase family protein n=1 Tax=Bosea sp. CRIB-10 TaxID=378404 RepID=UPI0008E91E0A|nr:copper oxidase [Bosea sp. CRIB-10]SFC81613.1 Multicopper oxidase with three cupredoxin domains (includes cell division protein FtsP and spore coat protein CotA) [Bosea sp. CRIB-10]
MTTLSRRGFIGTSGLVVAAAGAVSGRTAFAAVPEAPTMTEATTQAPLVPTTGPDYQPVATLNGWTLPWRMNGDWKEFHLVAEPVVREFAPGMKGYLWGYNGQSPGPTIEAVEGDRVRIFVTNKLPESTTIHWHGQRLPNGMDGVGGLNQPHIPSGKTFVYEFQLRRSGTYMYHPHSDEMVQMAMGMMGFFVVHPKDPAFRRVDRDFVFLLNAFDIEPGSYVPRVAEMTEFNMWCWNSRVFPGIDPLVVGKNDKVRIRFGNLTMTNHPIHMHGYEFKVSCTDGGWVDPAAAWDEVSIDVAVGQMRAFDFVADELGDWAIHCHKSHHTMNAMGHSVKNYIGVNKKDLAKRIARIAPGYMPMGSNGMGEMGSMEMPLPENTLPMMTGFAQFGPVEMGGMFSVVKVREGLAKNDYKDPGWFKHPEGTVAFEYKGQKLAEAPRGTSPDSGLEPTEWKVKDPRKPNLGPDGKPRAPAKNPHSNH